MRFYTQTHKHYCGIDLHARSMYLCILAMLKHRQPFNRTKFLAHG